MEFIMLYNQLFYIMESYRIMHICIYMYIYIYNYIYTYI